MNISEEKDLINRAKKDPQAFGEIFDIYHDNIFGYVMHRVGKIQITEDIVSETFLKAIDRLWQFRWRGISISNWLYRIANNEINQYFRKKDNNVQSLNEFMEDTDFDIESDVNILEEIIGQERELLRAEEWIKVRKKMGSLPEKYQEVIALRYFENKKIKEISEILNKKEGTVKSLLSRAVSILNVKMQPK